MLVIPEVSDWVPRTDCNSLRKWPWRVSDQFSYVVSLDRLQFFSSFNQWVKCRGTSSPVFHKVKEVVGDQIVEISFNNHRHFVAFESLVNVVLALFFNCDARDPVKISGRL